MLENRNESGWLSLPNPFPKISKQTMPVSIVGGIIDTSEAITGHVSCRRTDIANIIMDEQSAIFLVGTQGIGKSTLIRYLQRSPEKEWTWREELMDLNDRLQLKNIHFMQIDLSPLEGIEDSNILLSLFIKQCTQ